MQRVVDRLSEETKKELIAALYQVDNILEEASGDNGNGESDYHTTRFYDGMYDLMYRLGQWC